FASLCSQIGYRRKKLWVRRSESVTMHGLNWSGGSRTEYAAADIMQGKVQTAPQLGRPHPMNNENEGARIAMRPGVLILEYGTFMGKPAMLTIHVHPENFPAFLENA